MNLQQAKIILAKINTLHNSISLDSDNISAIEKDLMLNYVRQLYDAFLDEQTNGKAFINKQPQEVRSQVVTPAPVEEKVVTRPAVKKPRVVDVPDSIKEYAKAPVAEKPEPVKATTTTTTPAAKPVKPKKDHDILFEHEEAKELSDKLSSMPIRDLTKAMGLNEKILTINELFGGDHRAFDDAIKDLNKLKSFDEAKVYMSENLAEKYSWGGRGKKKKAQIFIKLIRRRYN